MNVTPRVAQNTGRPSVSSIDVRTTPHEGCGVSQKRRKRIEEYFRRVEQNRAVAQAETLQSVQTGEDFRFYSDSLQALFLCESWFRSQSPGDWAEVSLGATRKIRGEQPTFRATELLRAKMQSE
jgi:hypothetical protein